MKKVIVAAACGVSLFCAACRKPKEVKNTDTSNIYAVMQTMGVKPKTVSLSATDGGSFYGASGARYIFPPAAFCTPSGTVVAGMVDIQMAEYLKKGDMLFSCIFPVSNQRALVSGGEFYIKATQGGRELNISPGKTYQVNLPQGIINDTGMQLFFGQTGRIIAPANPALTLLKYDTANGVINWVAAPTRGTVIDHGDTISIISDSMHYINADRFPGNVDFQSFTVTVDAEGKKISKQQLMAFALYDRLNGFWQMALSTIDIDGNTIRESRVPSIPVHFAVATIIDGQFYGGILGATPTNGSNYTIKVHPMTVADYKKMVDAL